MIKRGIFQLTGAEPKLRISKPGIDVDTAGPTDFLLHEDFLYTQPYFAQFVACPFAGRTTTGYVEAAVPVAIPNVTSDPLINVWIVQSDGPISYPCQRGQGSGNSGSGFNIDAYYVRYKVDSGTQVTVWFMKPDTSKKSPQGAYLMCFRKPQ
ncbi:MULTISPECIES: hypothetical protein [unclassified Mesorhizobium]|uniref:hypothetical protein n=1 Tax=unclassified Mesorhizobium TaxID=325217 RepID=UPI000FD9FC50|nr:MULTISPECIES: hypothetical protein [unclassified Mesorhizobium]TGT64102.1 hypothetical protein EN809_035180 [Mesorhizobium sp. M2E.F.Ca.ET.166.01.1.1]TGV97015.1 hypothetical protein EN797_034985 [Mesorhizobium sp. M2E.F.Ca.ET.154.01.1.1]